MAKVKDFRGTAMIDGPVIKARSWPAVRRVAEFELESFCFYFMKALYKHWLELHSTGPSSKGKAVLKHG